MKIKNTNKGYSLLELLVYVALFAMISVLLVHSLVVLMRTYASAQGFRRLQNNGELIIERITREVRDAESISTGTFGTHPGTLTLASGGDTVAFAVSNGAATITENSTTGILSTSQVAVTNMVFRRITTPVGEGVKVELTLTATGGVIRTASFYSTALLRTQ
ncbi:MAG TPA: prepilin-type N-terminal cleavage/methylation domain-containing protein [Candidatus Paceibacterota bacterium]